MGQVDGSESPALGRPHPLPPCLNEYIVLTELVTTYIMSTPTSV